MRVLILDQYSELGGAQRMLLDLLPAIEARRWGVLVALPGNGPALGKLREQGIETEAIDCGRYASGRKSAGEVARFAAGIPRLAGQIRSLVRKFQPDLLHINGPRLLPAAAWAGISKPVLFHAHLEVSQKLARRVAGYSLSRLNAQVVAVCEAVADAWQPFVGHDRVSVIYNGVAGPSRPPARTEEGIRIGCIGRIAPEKGQREFLKAAEAIGRALPEARFVVCGAALFSDATAAAYEQQVRAAAAGLPVEFTGWAHDVYAVMANLDLVLVPSVWPEPNPRVVLEAFAAGLPVVAFRAGGLPEIIEHGRTGFLCDDVEEMAAVAVMLLQADRARLHQISEAARDSWRRRFTLERWRQDMLGAMERAVCQISHTRLPAR